METSRACGHLAPWKGSAHIYRVGHQAGEHETVLNLTEKTNRLFKDERYDAVRAVTTQQLISKEQES